MIEFRNVSKSYKNNQVLQDINFTIYDGEIVVLIGPSGCGKSSGSLPMSAARADSTSRKPITC